MSTYRVNGRAALAICTVTVLAILTVGNTAFAADGDDARGFPAVTSAWSAPSWYSTTPAFNGYSGALLDIRNDSSLEDQNISVYYYRGGRDPGAGYGDISIRYSPPDWTDAAQIDFKQLPVLTGDLGTDFVDVALLPFRPRQSLLGSSVETAAPSISLKGSVLTIIRPTCGQASEHSLDSKFQMALLATDGFKYLADVEVMFSGKANTACDQQADAVPSPSATTESAPVETEQPQPNVVVDSSSTSESGPGRKAALQVGTANGITPWMLIAALVLVLVMGAVTYARVRPHRTPAFDPDAFMPDVARVASTTDQPIGHDQMNEADQENEDA